MLEIRLREVAIIACHGEAGALDRLANLGGLRLRIAPDEVWLLDARAGRAALARTADAWRAGTDGNALVVDQTDGWTVMTVTGDERSDLFSRLSVSPPPSERPALLQGALSGVPGKVLFVDDATHYFVPGPVGHHLEARIRDTSDDLGLRFAEPSPWAEGGR